MAKKKAIVSTVLPSNSNKSFNDKLFRRVPTDIVADTPEFIPQYETEGAACCDLKANLQINTYGNRQVTINPGHTAKIDCGFSMAVPAGYEAQVRARSGLASKGIVATSAFRSLVEEGVIVPNEPGTIDEDYRYRLMVLLSNIGKTIIVINHMDRIAQMALKPVWYFDFNSVEELSVNVTTRKGGFGSTGI